MIRPACCYPFQRCCYAARYTYEVRLMDGISTSRTGSKLRYYTTEVSTTKRLLPYSRRRLLLFNIQVSRNEQYQQQQQQSNKRRSIRSSYFSTTTAPRATTTTKRRRIVVTGIGAVTPLGITFNESWQRLILPNSIVTSTNIPLSEQQYGITTLDEALRRQYLPEHIIDVEEQLRQQLPCQIAAPIAPEFSVPYNHRTSRYIQLALHATKDAIQQSGLQDWIETQTTTSDTDSDDTTKQKQKRYNEIGVCIANAMSSVRTIVNTADTAYGKGGYRKISPFFVPNCLPNTAAGQVAITYGFCGPNHTVSTACAAGGHAIGDAYTMLQNNSNLQIMICGGTESCIDPLSIAGFCRLNAMVTSYNNIPSEGSRPFDLNRQGFVMAEGAAVLVLEELQHALARNAPTILAEITGYSLSGDAYHITSPDPNYQSAQICLQQALVQNDNDEETNSTANIDGSNAVGYINAHATSTPVGDTIEAQCIENTIPNRLVKNVPLPSNWYVSSTKGATGHLLGAAGALEAAFTVMSLRDQIIPPTKNLTSIDPSCQFTESNRVQHVPDTPLILSKTEQQKSLEVAVSNSFGFGGTNSCLVFRRYRP